MSPVVTWFMHDRNFCSWSSLRLLNESDAVSDPELERVVLHFETIAEYQASACA